MDWIEALRTECQRTSQNKAADRLGVSSAQVSQVLRGKYPGNTAAIEARVRGELMGECVECPVLGEIDRRRCLDEQGAGWAATNPLRVKLFQACPTCVNRTAKEVAHA